MRFVKPTKSSDIFIVRLSFIITLASTLHSRTTQRLLLSTLDRSNHDEDERPASAVQLGLDHVADLHLLELFSVFCAATWKIFKSPVST